MPFDFDQAKRVFDKEGPAALYIDADGLRFLKLRSLSRAPYLTRLAEEAGYDEAPTAANDLLRFLYDVKTDDALIEATIDKIYEEERRSRLQLEPALVSELYKVDTLDWGGLFQNSLERTIVDRYVKRLRGYDRLNEAIESDLQASLRSYVVSSWYNHWTSILIEDLFRDHPAVLPAVGLVKQIDFFWHNVPFDLKVTFFPEGFIAGARRDADLQPELTVLKRNARELGISWDNDLPNGRLLRDLWLKFRDDPRDAAGDIVSELTSFRDGLLESTRRDPRGLMVWLYENQGVRRFDASNRLFLVLVDPKDYFDSWKLKRMHPLLKDAVSRELDATEPGTALTFSYGDATYETLAHTIFIVRRP